MLLLVIPILQIALENLFLFRQNCLLVVGKYHELDRILSSPSLIRVSPLFSFRFYLVNHELFPIPYQHSLGVLYLLVPLPHSRVTCFSLYTICYRIVLIWAKKKKSLIISDTAKYILAWLRKVLL
ncbi:hypothetical protein WN66_02036 [Saccharomyces cerevisiae]|nr:hypothetical protein WN66_02036 [Saccharomyces cerevisiae]